MQRKNFLPLSLFVFVVLLLGSCNHPGTSGKENSAAAPPLPVIFETDMGNDIDDALALAMLNNYMKAGKVDLLAVMSNKDNPYSCRYIDITDTWYGHGKIPIGKVIHGKTPDHPSYTKVVAEMKEEGKPVFQRSVKDDDMIPDAVALYRRILSKAPDSSVVIVSVGFSTNLARLLQSGADTVSSLTGKELVGKKVKLLSVMAGCFDHSIPKEYNIYNDVPAAHAVFAEWPTPVVVSPFEVGARILYPAASIEKDFSATPHHPVADAYKSFMKMPYDRPCWDPTAVLYAVEPGAGWFTLSLPGTIAVDTVTAATSFTALPQGKHCYLQADSLQAAKVRKRLVEVVTGRISNK